MNNKQIKKFLKELRDSSDIIYDIYTKGSCFRLYSILKTIDNSSEAYWSDTDNHCITKIGACYYDIGGRIKKGYIIDNSYYKIDKSQLKGFKLLKYVSKNKCIAAKVEKYER